jgi:hypothetical protein
VPERELEFLQQIGLLEKTGTNLRIPILYREGLSIRRGVAPDEPLRGPVGKGSTDGSGMDGRRRPMGAVAKEAQRMFTAESVNKRPHGPTGSGPTSRSAQRSPRAADRGARSGSQTI